MALTYTPAGQLGSPLPNFSLPNVVDDQPYGSVDAKDAVTLVAFICNHCPYVMAIEARLLDLAREFKPRGLVTLAICANDPSEHPADAPAELRRRALEMKYPFPYLIDHSQSTARAFAAVCTPDFFLYDRRGRLVYRGRLDDSWRDPSRVSKRELATAIDLTLNQVTITAEQNPSMGCSIKWIDE